MADGQRRDNSARGVLILDCDGVINRILKGKIVGSIDMEVLGSIASLCLHFGLDVLLSSSWRNFQNQKDDIESALASFGVKMVACTPSLQCQVPANIARSPEHCAAWQRAHEILQWCRASNVAKVVILDDLPLSDYLSELRGSFVQVDREFGFTDSDFAKASRILGGSSTTRKSAPTGPQPCVRGAVPSTGRPVLRAFDPRTQAPVRLYGLYYERAYPARPPAHSRLIIPHHSAFVAKEIDAETDFTELVAIIADSVDAGGYFVGTGSEFAVIKKPVIGSSELLNYDFTALIPVVERGDAPQDDRRVLPAKVAEESATAAEPVRKPWPPSLYDLIGIIDYYDEQMAKNEPVLLKAAIEAKDYKPGSKSSLERLQKTIDDDSSPLRKLMRRDRSSNQWTLLRTVSFGQPWAVSSVVKNLMKECGTVSPLKGFSTPLKRMQTAKGDTPWTGVPFRLGD